MRSLHPVSWMEKRDLGNHSVLPRGGRYWAADPYGIFMVVLTWPLIAQGGVSSTSFRSLLDVVINQGKGW